MPKQQGPQDPNVRAYEVVQQATGEMPKEQPPADKSPAAVQRGHARAESLTPEQRKAIAKKAAENRWKKPD